MDLRRARRRRSSQPGQFVVRELLGRQHHHHAIDRPDTCTRSTTSAAIAARGSAPSRRDVRRQHPVPVSRLDLRPRRPADRRAAHGRSAALPQGRLPAAPRPRRRLGRPHLHQPVAATRRRSRRSWPICPRSSAPWRMQDLRLGHRIVYDVKANWKLIVQNYNECLHCPNLHPALNKLSHYLSGENEPLQRDLHGRPDGSAARRRHAVDGRNVPASVAAGLSGRGSPARLLLRDLPEHAAQPAPRLHDGAHAVADRARPHHQRLRVALPARGAGAARVRSRRMRWSSGT